MSRRADQSGDKVFDTRPPWARALVQSWITSGAKSGAWARTGYFGGWGMADEW